MEGEQGFHFSTVGGDNMKSLWLIVILIPVTFFSIEILHTEDLPVDRILGLLQKTRMEVLLASYSLDQPELVSTLNNLSAAGITVSVIIDDSTVSRLMALEPKFKIMVDGPVGLLHSKFMVLDGKTVIMGTGNFTVGSLEEDPNSFMIFDSEKIAGKFRDYYKALQNGTGSLTFSEREFQFYLLPDATFQKRLIAELLAAKDSIYFMCYAFTSPEIFTLLKYKSASGISVKGLVDDWNLESSPYSDYFTTGMEVTVNTNAFLLHDKTIIIDGKTVITGSANFTDSSFGKNREVAVLIESEEVARRFADHFSYIREVVGHGNQDWTGSD